MNKKIKNAIIACICATFLMGCAVMLLLNTTYYQSTLLRSAIQKGDAVKVSEIIDKHPETLNVLPTMMPEWWRTFWDYGHTIKYPVDEAISSGNAGVVEALLNAGVNVDDFQFARICGGSNKSNADIAFLLIERGVDINSGGTALQNSVIIRTPDSKDKKEKKYRLFDYLLENCDLSKVDFPATFTECGFSNNVYAAKRLLNGGYVDINCVNESNQTALICAAFLSQSEIVNYLIDQGADKFIKDKHGKTAYDYAVETGDMELAALLKP